MTIFLVIEAHIYWLEVVVKPIHVRFFGKYTGEVCFRGGRQHTSACYLMVEGLTPVLKNHILVFMLIFVMHKSIRMNIVLQTGNTAAINELLQVLERIV